jgi:hypothetical protein
VAATHRAYGSTVLHTVGLPARANPLRTCRPAVLLVGPLLRELIIAYTRDPQEESSARSRLRSVMLRRRSAILCNFGKWAALLRPAGPIYLFMVRVLDWLVLLARGDAAKDAEISSST